MIAPVLVVGGQVAIGHLADTLRVQEFKVIVLVKGVHVQLPAEVGEHLLRAQVIVVFETETRQSLSYSTHHLVDIKALVGIGHDKNHAVFFLDLQRFQAQGAAVDAVEALLAERYTHQAALKVIGPTVIGAGE